MSNTYKQGAAGGVIAAPRDGMEAVARDAHAVFGWDPERRPQDRAHDYLRGRGVQRGSDDTAMERVALDLADRAARAVAAIVARNTRHSEEHAMECVMRVVGHLCATGGDVR